MTHGRYSTDLTDRQWAAIADLVPAPKPGGRPAKFTRREVVNAILYQTRNGCTWRDLPKDLPPYRVAFHYFRLWQTTGVWRATRRAVHRSVRNPYSAGSSARHPRARLSRPAVGDGVRPGCGLASGALSPPAVCARTHAAAVPGWTPRVVAASRRVHPSLTR